MTRTKNPLLPMRMAVNIGLDGGLAVLAVGLSFWLANPAQPEPRPLLLPLAGAVAIWLLGIPFGLARLHWRYVAPRDLVLMGSAALLTAAMLTLLMTGAGIGLPSLSFPVILALTLGAFLTVPKLLYRLMHQTRDIQQHAVQTAMLVGDGEANELFLSAHARQRHAPYRIIGLIGLSAKHIGRQLHGLTVVGAAPQSEAMLARLAQKPDLLIITAPEFSGDHLKTLMRAAEALDIRVMRAPTLTKLAPAEQKVVLQPIAIEDLLNRRQVRLNRDAMAELIAGRRVMVTGAGGSIGSELCRQLVSFAPTEILLLDSSEFALWQIDLELQEAAPTQARQAVIADVRDQARLRAIMQTFRPELVFHAAALKHVPMLEHNRLEGVRTNALGTQCVADEAEAAGARLMVLISTDKAVNPTSVMGATKRLAEMYTQALDVQTRHARQGLRCVTVRFGNVLGSTGSVVPIFRRQLAQGGPLTITDPQMQRYFMTIPEAVGLVLQASVVGSSEEAIPDGGIFVLDMGEPVKILDLARQMIRLAGLRPDEDIEIKFTGLRPGEKLFEELFHGAEQPVPTGHEGLLMATPRLVDMQAVRAMLATLSHAAQAGDEDAVLTLLRQMVPEFLPPTGLVVPNAAE